MSKMPGLLLRLKSATAEDKLTANELRREKTREKKSRTSPDRMDVLKRHSLAGLTGRSKSKDTRTPSRDTRIPSVSNARHSPSPALRPTKPVNKLKIAIESPPNMFYGNPTQSSGALMSGQLLLTVIDPDFSLDSLDMAFYASVTVKKPVSHGCPECTTQRTKLHGWKFLSEVHPFDAEDHSFPFSFLLPGHLPATSKGFLGTLEYHIEAHATVTRRPGQEPEMLTLNYEVPVMRALNPVPEKNSLRIFPPTNLTAHVSLAPVIHPIGDFNVLMKLNGLLDKTKDVVTRWRLRKMTWKIEEMEKMISAACTKHSAKLGGEGKGVQHEDVRTLGGDELKEGWKSDWSDGTLELEFSARPLSSHRPLCDVESPTGLTVTHALVIELVVAEEWAPLKRPDALTPTGAARVLRMQFQLMITERSGMGISWDEEQPPMYENVPASPPIYAADAKLKMRLPSMPAHALINPSMAALSSGSQQREPSMLRFASSREYTGPPLNEDSLDEEVERLDLGDGSSGPSAVHFGDYERPSARSRRRLDLDDFVNDEVDPRGPPPPPRDDD